MSDNLYEIPVVSTIAESSYEVPMPSLPKRREKVADLASLSQRGAEGGSCSWRLPLLCACACLVAVVASASLALTVWTVVVGRMDFAQDEAIANLSAAVQSLQDQVDVLQDENSQFMQLFPGWFPSNPASSCSAVSRSSPSGYYWIRHVNGSVLRVYCDMTRTCGSITGGWTRVAYLQFENGSDPCPQGFRERNDSGIRTCGINSTTAACPSILFDTYGIPYSRVCGKVLGYQYGHTDAFAGTELAPGSTSGHLQLLLMNSATSAPVLAPTHS